MTTARDARALSCCTHVGIALALLVTTARDAAADGERTPMVGIAIVGADVTRSPQHDLGLGGLALDLAWWHGRLGLAAEASSRWSIDAGAARATVLGASVRLRVLESMMPSLLDPSDVELGIELQGIVERTWWNDAVSDTDPVAYGVGLALRVRGVGDLDGSNRLAESRFFLRVMASRWNGVDAAATRMTRPEDATERALTVLVGIGASWGGGSPSYVQRFRLRPLERTLLW